MKYRNLLAFLLVGIFTWVLLGCNGSSPGLNPQVTLTYSLSQTGTFAALSAPPVVPSGMTLYIYGTATTSDATNNPVTSYQWSETPQNPSNPGTFFTPTLLTTLWEAPTVNSTTTYHLMLEVRSLEGGRTLVPVNVNVIPAVAIATFTYNGESTLPSPFTVGSTLNITAKITAADMVNNPPVSYVWSEQANATNTHGAFSNSTSTNTTWTAPASLPTGQSSVTIILTLTVITAEGNQTIFTIPVTVT